MPKEWSRWRFYKYVLAKIHKMSYIYNYLKGKIMEEIKLGRTKLYVTNTGTKIMTAIIWLLFIAAVILLIAGLSYLDSVWSSDEAGMYIGLAVGVAILGILMIPAKCVVKAAEYYISMTEDSYETVSDKAFKPSCRLIIKFEQIFARYEIYAWKTSLVLRPWKLISWRLLQPPNVKVAGSPRM